MVLVRLLYDIALNLHVLHDEVGAIKRVRHYSANKSSGKNDGIRLFLVKETSNGQLVCEVQLTVGSPNKVVVPTLFEIIPNCGTNKTMVAGNINFT